MKPCKVYEFLYRGIPLKPWQDTLIGRHFESCPACRKQLATREEARRILVLESDVVKPGGLWPAVVRMAEERRGAGVKRSLPVWLRLSSAAAALILVVAAAIWLFRAPDRGPGSRGMTEPSHFEVRHPAVGGKPARAILFRPHDSKMIFIWIEKKEKENRS